jgi:alpha-L-arabinofuranosidase
MKSIRLALRFALALTLAALAGQSPLQPRPAAAQSGSTSTITVQVDRPGAAISPRMFGVFFEDINFAADGGLYPERVKNRAFEFPTLLMGWKKIERGGAKGTLEVLDAEPLSATTPRYLRVKVEEAGAGFGAANEGFRGVGVERGARYTFSVYARRAEGSPSALRAELVDANGKSLGQARVSGFTPQWKKHAVTLTAAATEAKAALHLYVEGRGALDLDLVSLFPQATWKNRANGLRPDLVKLLAELKPGFVRFPGGCIVEGRTLDERYQWKTTVGDLAERKLIINRWNQEFKTRFPQRAPEDYYQSFGLGFYEYFQLCEDIGAEPLPIINCGMACQFNTGQLVPLDQLDPYIQDALDLIEFANGPVTSRWGGRRAAMGHPAPFNLKMIGVGNEQWGPQYIERYAEFAKVLKAKHPEIKLVASAGPSPSDERFHYLWGKMREMNADIVDEHYYMPPKWFRENAGRYDSYPRTGPKVFAGEYAAQSVGVVRSENRNDWECALSEAAFLTGLERNADVVEMTSYAPLLAHVDAWQWTPNLIWFDNLRSFGTPSYYVQKLFSTNRGTTILPVKLGGGGGQDLYASASLDRGAGEVILKVVNTAASAREVSINLAGVTKVGAGGKAFVLSSADLKAENSLNEPAKVAPAERQFAASGQFAYTLAPHSLTVLRVPTQAQSAAVEHDSSRWEGEIAAYEQADRTNPPPPGGVLFIGSSTIRLWKTLAEDFPGHRVINRGFGGSQIADATHFAERVIFPYRPRAVFLRAGGNDLHAGKSPERVFADFKAFVNKVHAKLPQTEIVFISLSPSVARWSEAEQTKKLNQLVRDYVKGKKRLKYIETYETTLGPDGKPRPELFVEDKLHFNAEGYRILAERVRPHLPK